MANNQKKLKAFVRYDGSGRVVASSLILRKNKPRVGRWFEIPTYDCCNGDSSTTSSTTTVAPGTTTTTTTAGGGSTTTTTTTSGGGPTTTTTTTSAPAFSFVANYGYGSAGEACFAGMSQTFYTPGPLNFIYPQTGNVIYVDEAMTQIATYAYISSPGIGAVWQCINGVLSNQSTCN